MADQEIQNPTYLGDIRHFFDPVDLDHMGQLGIDLSTYEALKERATSVFFQTKPPTASMPPGADRKWSVERSSTFENWIRNGFPLGVPTPELPTTGTADRVRKDASALTQAEIDQLARAFGGIMGREQDDPSGYFLLAGRHWFPVPNECLHHEDRYNPWHRVYVTQFEDALRSVSGCESVTLPYWDITQRPPDFLFTPPFDTYTLPAAIHLKYPAGYATSRFDADKITEVAEVNGLADIIDYAMQQPIWGDFVTYQGAGIEAAHDTGHGVIGPTMSNPDAAAFDPIFWFFHANWDRLWWQWQQIMGATTLTTFRSTIMGSTDFLEVPFNGLPPFETTADKTIDLSAMRISYTQPAGQAPDFTPRVSRGRVGSLRAFEGIRVHEAAKASVRLKGINRLSIPGSFRAILRADGEVIGRRTFFQSTEPVECANCRERAKIDLDFLVDLDEVLGKTLSTSIEVITPDPESLADIPLAAAGDPTLNVRLLVERS